MISSQSTTDETTSQQEMAYIKHMEYMKSFKLVVVGQDTSDAILLPVNQIPLLGKMKKSFCEQNGKPIAGLRCIMITIISILINIHIALGILIHIIIKIFFCRFHFETPNGLNIDEDDLIKLYNENQEVEESKTTNLREQLLNSSDDFMEQQEEDQLRGEQMDLYNLTEDDLSLSAKFYVFDNWQPAVMADRALKSLPKILFLKPTCSLPDSGLIGVWAKEFIPAGTRFGPIVGEVYPALQVPQNCDRRHFWRVYDKKTNEVDFFVDGMNIKRSNWMRYALPAYQTKLQNLVAYQHDRKIFFMTTKAICANEELVAWFCKDFADRLGYPATGQLMMETAEKLFMHSRRAARRGRGLGLKRL